MRIRIIYLAAGNSRRFYKSVCRNRMELPEEQRNKLFYLLRDEAGTERALYEHLLRRLVRIVQKHPQWELCVVSQYEEILKGSLELWKEEGGDRGGLIVAESPLSRLGISYSVRAGITANEEIPDAYAFFAADQPFLSEASAEGFLCKMEEKEAGLGCVRCLGQEGNPAWFAAGFRESLLALEGDAGGRKILRAEPERVCHYEIKNPAELEDIDELPEK